MNLFAMALITIRRGMGYRLNLANLMPEGSVTARAFDLMVGDMLLMRELGGILRTQ